MKQYTILIISLIIVSSDVAGQRKVMSGSFNTVLNIILNHDVKEVTVPQASARKNALFLDAREQKEFDVSHIRHAMYAGYNNFDIGVLKNVAKSREIIVYCSIGKRSEKITRTLTKAGYSNVHNLYGGIFEWVNQGFGVVDANDKRTMRVHAYGKFWGHWLGKGDKVYD